MVCAGIDVSKDVLACCMGEEIRSFSNDPLGISELLRFASGADLLCMEATGRYHLALATAAFEAGTRCVVVNPGQAKQYLAFVSMRGKTDAQDARALARLGEAEGDRLRQFAPNPQWVDELRDIIVRRKGLVESRVSLEQVAQATGDPGGHLASAIEAIKRSQAALDKEMEKRLAHRPGYQHLKSIPGVGPVSAALALCALARGEFASSDSLVAFAGLDPRPSDSGQKRGRRVLSHKGDAQLRTAFFMAARAGARLPEWKDYYAAQRAKGLSSTEATVVLARKLLRVAWSVHKQEGPFIHKERPTGLDNPT